MTREAKAKGPAAGPWLAILPFAVWVAALFVLPSWPAIAVEPASAEAITPVPRPASNEVAKIVLGERLFRDPRLSRDNARSCASCHDVDSNGASKHSHDRAADGSDLPFNTPTVFNAALSFRFNWEGGFRSLQAQAAASIENPRIMDLGLDAAVARLRDDPDLVRAFEAAYGRGPDQENLVDAIVAFERSLLTPDSRFDLWLRGDESALSAEELEGYRQFKSLGCSACHQGVNVGGNLFSRHGIFRPLASPKPEVLRVPSLRNIDTTAPYFHDGSAPTLEDAIRRMGASQLNSTLTDQQVTAIAGYLRTLTGSFRGQPVRKAP